MAGLIGSPDPSSSSHADLLDFARQEVVRFHDLRQSALGSNAEAADSFDSFNFGDRNLTSLPEELVDIIKDHTVRIALDRNLLTGLSGIAPRLGEFARLKYLVLRHNQLEEFPTSVFDLPGLEYLDLRSNQIRELPSDLNRLTAIKVISIKHNLVRRLPLCIGQMNTLQFMTTKQNPIEFPDKKEWRIDARTSDKDADDKRRLVDETTKLKKVLQKYAAMSPTQRSEFSDPTVEGTARPLKSARGGRFPIRPSVSSVNLEAAAQLSPSQPRPPLTATRATHRPTMAASVGPTRPTIDPLAAADGDRHRSNSESHMSAKSRKRMGMQVSRGGKGSAEILDLDSVNGDSSAQNHNRDVSTSSLLSNAMSLDGTDSSPSPSTPSNFELRENAASRLSSLPENKRKSQYVDPFVELAQSITFSIEQVEGPVRAAVNATKTSNSRRRGLERSAHSAFSSKRDLSDVLTQLGIYDEAEEPEDRPKNDKSKPFGSIGDRCEKCILAFQKLIESLQEHTVVIVEHTNGKFVRLLMHMLFASAVEVQNAYKKFCFTARGMDQAHQPKIAAPPLERKSSRAVSPSPRPTTSLRIKNPQDIHTYLAHKPLPSPRLRNGERPQGRAPSRSQSRLGETHNPSASTLSTSSSFISTASSSFTETDEEGIFEDIIKKLNVMADTALGVLPTCSSLLQESRQRYPTIMHTMPPGGRYESYDVLMHLCSEAQGLARDLKTRLQTLRIREAWSRDQNDFWQLCTAFIRAHFDFAKAIQAQIPLLGLSDGIRNKMRPLHYSSKEVTHAINNSPWNRQARHVPGVGTPLSASLSINSAFSPVATTSVYSPASNPTSATTPRSKQRPSRTLTINSSISSVSSQNGPNSGYTTPLPATPISAALGPAAQATLGGFGHPVTNGNHANGIAQSPISNGHDASVASLSAMPGWYNQGLDGMPLSSNGAASPSINQPINRSASSASIRGMGQRAPPPSSISRSVSQRR